MNKSENNLKSYAIIGFGKIGQALAKAFARSHIPVAVATTRVPESFADEAAAIGPELIPKTLTDATQADILFLAVGYSSHTEVAKTLPAWEGKIIVDMTNAYGIPFEQLAGQPSARVVENAFTGSKVVKGFNHLIASRLGQDPAGHGGRRVVFLASDDDSAAAEIGHLAEDLGFAPVQLGRLAHGGMLIHGYGKTWGPLIFQDLIKFD